MNIYINSKVSHKFAFLFYCFFFQKLIVHPDKIGWICRVIRPSQVRRFSVENTLKTEYQLSNVLIPWIREIFIGTSGIKQTY